mmetsp:Transcript_12078/g.28624  ORF Transcript_12078/g.28624 Transcript_12078/m.28624 type:complete len:163 (-) Transcript_12078:106-594(-)
MIIRSSVGLCIFCMASGHSGHTQHPSSLHKQAMTVDPDGDLSTGPVKQLMRNEIPDASSLSEIENGQARAAQEAEMLEAEGIPINAADLAYRAMDLAMGTTGMSDEDYPFACLCNAEGMCEGDPASTSCKMRSGQPNAASGMPWLQALVVPLLMLLFQLPRE